MTNPGAIKAGSVSYYTPEIFASKDYGAAGAGEYNKTQAGLTTITVDTRRMQKWE